MARVPVMPCQMQFMTDYNSELVSNSGSNTQPEPQLTTPSCPQEGPAQWT